MQHNATEGGRQGARRNENALAAGGGERAQSSNDAVGRQDTPIIPHITTGVNAMLAAALDYAKRGWHVFPLVPRGKKPFTPLAPHGFKNASTDPDTIRAWWATAPTANVGIRTGHGLLVLDVDGDAGQASLDKRQLPPTVCVRTGRGSHYYYEHNSALASRNGVLKGLDVKSEGGYVVAPPSVHPSGDTYEWALEPQNTPLAPPPAWLLDLLRPAADRAEAPPVPEVVREGSRNETLTSVAGSLRRRGLDADTIAAALLAVNKNQCRPPLPEAEVRGIAASVARYSPGNTDGDSDPLEAEPQVVRLMRIAEAADLFRAENSEPHATLPNGETVAMAERGGGFRSWLCNRFVEAEGRPPSSSALTDANMACLAAATEKPLRTVALRAGEAENTVYLDLANDKREVVAITADGWTVTTKVPTNLRFRRPHDMRALPRPDDNGDIAPLRDFLNVNDDDFKLCVAWLLATLRTGVPYPILTLLGEQGTAKSTATRLLRRIVDAASPETTRPPDCDADLFAVANNNYVLALENISYLPQWLSDSLAAIATGAGNTRRKLYTDGDTYSCDARRPIIMNGIGEIATRGDLIDRCLVAVLQNIRDEDRIDERTFWSNAETILPGVLGGLLTAASTAIKRLPYTQLTAMPRMADFARWIVAAEPALPWQAGDFMTAYLANREGAILSTLDGDAFSRHLYSVASEGFEGTATELGEELEARATDRETRRKSWPSNARAISERVTRLAPALRAAKIDVDRGRSGRKRTIIFRPQH